MSASTVAAPRPLALATRLLGGLSFLALLQAALLLAAGSLIFAGPAETAPLRARLGLFLAGLLVVSSLAVVELFRRTVPLYRAAARARDGGARIPPSQAAVRDALSAPDWIGPLTGGPAVLLGLSDAVTPQDLLGLSGSAGLAFDLFLVGVGLSVVTPAVTLSRATMSRWLSRFPPEEQKVHRAGRSSALGVDVALVLPVVGLALASLPALVVSLPSAARWTGGGALLLVSLAVLGVAVALARRLRATLAADLSLLARRATDAAAQTEGVLPPSLELSGAGFETEEVAALAAETDAMVTRWLATGAAEDRARATVQELQRSKMLFMASMSHDLRSPLNSILGFSELLQRAGSSLTEAQRENVRMIARSGEELLRLLEDVLDSARFEAGRLPLRRDWTPSVEILTEAVRQARELVEDGNLEIVAELQPGLPPVRVDRERIVQAVVGLFRHGARAMAGGTIRMFARVAPDPVTGRDQLRVDVLVRGGGIRAEDRERVFEAFREVTSLSGRRIGGLGLGLSLARALVRAHDGDVWIDTKPGEETTFTVAIPLSAG